MPTQPEIKPKKSKNTWVAYCYHCAEVKGNGFKSHVEPCVQFHLSLCPGPMYIRRAEPYRELGPYSKTNPHLALIIVLPNEDPDLALPDYDREEGN